MNDRTMAVGFMALLLGLGVGIASAWFWLGRGATGGEGGQSEAGERGGHGEDFERGPHGGRMLSANGMALEVTIYERGIPPQFRVFVFEGGKPVAPGEVDLRIRLGRLGGRVDDISFRVEGEYLVGDKVVEEPHSFDVEVLAARGGKSYSWEYSQYEGRVVLSAEAVRSAGIEVREAGGGLIAETLTLRGEIVLNADGVAHIVPRVSGQVREVRGHLGDTVRSGDVLAVIDSRELAEAKAGDLAAEAKLSLTRASLKRVENLFAKKISTEEELLKARQEFAEAEIEHRTAEAKLHALGFSEEQVRSLHEEKDVDYSRYEIKAPFGGTIIRKHVTLGEVVGPASDIYVLADLSRVWANFTVYQKDIAKVRRGQRVAVSFHGDVPAAEGVVDYITPEVDEATRTATARVVLENAEGVLRPGLFATGELVESEASVAVVVGLEAIQRIRDWSAVFVNHGDTFEARPLELGRMDGQRVEVLGGLSPGERYASKNSFILKAEVGKSGATHGH